MRWKRILGIAAVLLIAIIVAAYVILSTYDYNKFKPFIAKVVEDATGRKLTLSEGIKQGHKIKINFRIVEIDIGVLPVDGRVSGKSQPFYP